ncbi:MAG: hypothetical protein LBV47_03350 [Bacteroidales bacterium]|jgi:hypothetical protein|nr:hypothetical protein [Bacteroidales bacterium]
MKALKFMVLIFTILIINGCEDESKNINNNTTDFTDSVKGQEENKNPVGEVYPFYEYWLHLAVTDASGNDLTKGIGIEVAMYDPNSSYINGRYWVTGNEEEYTEGRIKPELYTLDIIFEDGIPNPLKPEPAPLINGRPAYVLGEIPPPTVGLRKGSSMKMYSHSTELLPGVNPDLNYLIFNFSSYRIYGLPMSLLYGIPSREVPFTEKVIFRLTCPYLFGDNEAHDIITWWELSGETFAANCYRMEFEGNEFNVKEGYAKTVILDR